jgi:hypothetical protein
MTPCIARDGHLALDDPRGARPECVGCSISPQAALVDLAKRWQPARRYLQTKDPVALSDRLRDQVLEYVEATK